MLLPPGCRFRVVSVLPQGELTIIQVEELPSSAWILDLNSVATRAQGNEQPVSITQCLPAPPSNS